VRRGITADPVCAYRPVRLSPPTALRKVNRPGGRARPL